ncbi:hypothetical protein AAFN46_07120 [Pseudomonas sp. CAU 1711]|uniref:hypothetical protein n=1 Tax=Pseudomonas sp. CAU 1711 TaxID=3140356 RepID=UPI003261A712
MKVGLIARGASQHGEPRSHSASRNLINVPGRLAMPRWYRVKCATDFLALKD